MATGRYFLTFFILTPGYYLKMLPGQSVSMDISMFSSNRSSTNVEGHDPHSLALPPAFTYLVFQKLGSFQKMRKCSLLPVVRVKNVSTGLQDTGIECGRTSSSHLRPKQEDMVCAS